MLTRMAEGVTANNKASEKFNFTAIGAGGVKLSESETSLSMTRRWEEALKGQHFQYMSKSNASRKIIEDMVSLSEEAILNDIRKVYGSNTTLTEMADITGSPLSLGSKAIIATTAIRHRFLEEANGNMNTVPSYQFAPLPTIAVTLRALQDSIFQELVHCFPMPEYQSALYLLAPVYGKDHNGVKAGTSVRTSNLNGYASSQRTSQVTGIDGTAKQFTLSVTNGQLEGPFYQNNARLIVNGKLTATIGPEGSLRTYGDVVVAVFVANQMSKTISIEFVTAPAIDDIVQVTYSLNFQDEANFEKMGNISMEFQRIPFQMVESPIEIKVNLLPELMYDTTMNVGLSPMILETTAKELARSLDFTATDFLNSLALSNGDPNLKFDVLFRNSGNTYISNPRAWRTYVIDQAITMGNTQINTKNKQGAITEMWGSQDAMQYFEMSERFVSSGTPAKNRRGAYRLGNIGDVKIFSFANYPTESGFRSNRVFYKFDDAEGMNVSTAIGIYSLFVESQRLQTKNFVKTQGAMSLTDMKEINPSYTGYFDLENYDPNSPANRTNY